MTSTAVGFAEERDPGFRYCQALKDLGIEEADGGGFFHVEDGRARLAGQVAEAIEKAGDNRDLARALASAAQAELDPFLSHGDFTKAVESLESVFDEVVEARIALWRTMIGVARTAREFTDVELAFYEKRIAKAASALSARIESADPQVVVCARAAHDRAYLKRYDLLFDDGMVSDIDRIASNVMNCRPTLVVGDKGIAKTQVAKFVMSLYDTDPLTVSVKGDMMSDELVGKLKHDRELNTFVFEEGVLLRAMRQGLPILLDEINFGDQSIIARLQDVLLKKPGETVFVQESGERFVVANGFAVMATANEASTRYRNREVLDPAIRDRFDVVIRTYPDLDRDPLVDVSGSLLRLAVGVAADPWGFPSRHVDLGVLTAFVRLAHATQLLYSMPGKDAAMRFGPSEASSVVSEESEPMMTDCITPRTVARTVADCAPGNTPGQRFDVRLVGRLLRSLDQANSSSNFDLAGQIAALMDIDLAIAEAQRGKAFNESAHASERPYAGLSEKALAALLP